MSAQVKLMRLKGGARHYAAKVDPSGIVTSWTEDPNAAETVHEDRIDKIGRLFASKPGAGKLKFLDHKGAEFCPPAVSEDAPPKAAPILAARTDPRADADANASVGRLVAENEKLRRETGELQDALNKCREAYEEQQDRADSLDRELTAAKLEVKEWRALAEGSNPAKVAPAPAG